MTTPPQPRLLHRAGGIHVFHRPGTTPWTLIAFGPRLPVVGPERWWGSGFGRNEALDVIGVAATGFDWYPRALMEEVLPVIREAAQPDRLSCGFAMGGYAALKYATALGAKAAIGLSPQFSIDPADGTADAWEGGCFDPARHGGMRIGAGDFPAGALLLWDPEVAGDDRHARAIARIPGIRPVPLRLAGSGTAAVFTETLQLPPVGEHLLAGRIARAVVTVRAIRRRLPSVLFTAATLLEAHGHRRWAVEADRRARLRPLDPARLQEARARAFARLGRGPEEIEALRAWVAATPRDPEARLRLIGCLQAQDRAAEAAAALREAIAADIRDPRLDAAAQAAMPAPEPAPEPSAEAAEGRPPPRLLAETDSLRLWFWPGEGPGTLIIFTPAGAAPAGPTEWWASAQASWLGWPTLVFAAHKPSWYPADEMAALLPRARAALPRGPRVTYGAGMGGYGALKYGRALGAEASVALAAVSSINPAEVPNDARWLRQFDPERHGEMRVRLRDLARLPIIAFDPLIRLDGVHARRLAALPPVRAVPLRRAGNGLTTLLVETRRFEPLLRAALQGDADGARAALREARWRSPRLREAVAAEAEARGHPNLAAGLRALPPADVRPPAAGGPAAGLVRRLSFQARLLRREQRAAEEEPVLRQWIAADPAAPEPRLMLSHCLLRLDRPAEAIEVLRKALRDGIRDGLVHAVLVRQLRRSGAKRPTLNAARAAAEALPEDAAILGLLGEICLWTEQNEEAAAAFRAALAIDPEHGEALLGLAALEEDPPPDGLAGPRLAAWLDRLAARGAPEAEWMRTIDRLWSQGRAAGAMLAARAALTEMPEAIGPAQRIGRFLLHAERSEEALAHFAALARAAPDDLAGWYGAIDALMAMKRNEEGRRIAEQAIARHPEDGLLALRHATFILATGEGAVAEREARRAVTIDPATEGPRLILIDALRRQERRRDAITAAQQALEAVPGSAAIALRLGGLLMDQGKSEAAAEIYLRMVQEQDKPARLLWTSLAEALDAAGRLDEAEEAVRKGLAAEPRAPELQRILGQILLRRGETEAAREALADAIAEDPGSPVVSLAMARALVSQGNRDQARALLEQVVAQSPGDLPSTLQLGQILLDDARAEEAGAIFFALTQAHPENPLAWMGLSDAYRLCKQVKPALAAYQQAIAAGLDGRNLRSLRYRLFGEYDG